MARAVRRSAVYAGGSMKTLIPTEDQTVIKGADTILGPGQQSWSGKHTREQHELLFGATPGVQINCISREASQFWWEHIDEDLNIPQTERIREGPWNKKVVSSRGFIWRPRLAVLTKSRLFLASREWATGSKIFDPSHVYEGWVMKQGAKNPLFKRRYFVLKNGVLKFYSAKPNDASNSDQRADADGGVFALEIPDAKGSLECAGMTVETSVKGAGFCFAIHSVRGTTDRRIVCSCKTAEERAAWVKHLQDQTAAIVPVDARPLQIIDYINLHEIVSVDIHRAVVNPIWENTPGAQDLLHHSTPHHMSQFARRPSFEPGDITGEAPLRENGSPVCGSTHDVAIGQATEIVIRTTDGGYTMLKTYKCGKTSS